MDNSLWLSRKAEHRNPINGSVNAPGYLSSATQTRRAPLTEFQWSRSSSETATGNYPSTLAIADFNRDGYPDLVTSNTDNSTLSILQGNGDGTFKEVSRVPVAAAPTFVAVGD